MYIYIYIYIYISGKIKAGYAGDVDDADAVAVERVCWAGAKPMTKVSSSTVF